jgi:GntR family uxuAB operon transcriptional repressor
MSGENSAPTSDLSHLPKGKRLYQVVARQIARLIEDRGGDPGWHLPSERELAEELQVSRPSVREAIIALEMRGIVEVRGRAGIVVLPTASNVPNFDAANTDVGAGPFEILEARKAVESSAAAIAASRATPYDIALLEENIANMARQSRTLESKDPADREFHRIIANMTGNAVIISMIEALWTQQESSRMWKAIHQRIYSADVQPLWVGQHYGILTALRLRNPDAANKAMWQHIASVASELMNSSSAESEWRAGGE